MAVTVAHLEAILSANTGAFDRSMEESHSKMGKVGKAAGVAGLAIAGGLAVGLEKSVHAAEEAQVSQSRLEAAFKSSGLVYEKHKQRIEEVESAQRKLGFTDTEVRDSIGSLIIATHSVSKATKDEAVAADIARFKHIGLEQASKMLTMAMSGSQRATKQLGLSVQASTEHADAAKAAYKRQRDALEAQFPSVSKMTAAQKEQLQAGKDNLDQQYAAAKAQATLQDKSVTSAKVIELVTKKLHGQSQAYADTAAGSMAQFHAQTEHLEATMGQALIPVLGKVAEMLATLMDFFAKHTTLAKVLAVALGVLAGALLAVSAATTLMNLAFLASPIGLIVLGIAALVAGLILAYKHSETFREIVQGAFKAVKVAVDDLIDVFKWIINHFDDIWGIAKWSPPLILIRGYIAGVREAVDLLIDVFKWVRDHFDDIWNVAKWSPPLITIRGLIMGVKEAAGFVQDVFTWVRDNGGDIWRHVKAVIGPPLNTIQTAFEDLLVPVNKIIDAFQWIIDNAGKVGGWIGKVGGVLSHVPGMAAGGPLAQGQAAIVGEYGPELFVPNVAGRIVPNGQLPTGGASSSQPTIVQLVVDSKTLAEVVFDPLRTKGAIFKQQNGRAAF